jgi:GNAT superfamily N-acetyltransferase
MNAKKRILVVDDEPDFAAIVGDAFDFGRAFRPALAALPGAEDWQVYMSFDGDTPAGTGALFTRGGIGYLDFGATRPDFRRRGGQTAVLRTRLLAAGEAGCEAVVTMTGEAVAGEEQHSYRNIERAGFSPAYLRENWVPADR